MARATLGEQIDIHTGGIDHIPVHHNNEIAQSESATGKKPFARVWMHNEFITIDEEKVSKSLGNTITLDELPQQGIHPLALRYFYLSARYSTPLNFSWGALKAAQQALLRLHFIFDQLDETEGEVSPTYQTRFHERINDNLDTPGAIAIMWEIVKDKSVSPASMRATLTNFDFVLGLSLGTADERLRTLLRTEFGEVIPNGELPDDVRILLSTREEARAAGEWEKADELRAAIQDKGYTIEDTPAGARLLKK
jgi:cysteinyl-tRNA synthetase